MELFNAQIKPLTAGENLSQQATQAIFERLIAGELSTEQILTLLTLLKEQGETPEEIAGAALALLQAALPFTRPAMPLLDTCGTGGDGQNTINISTAAALVLASMGAFVAKHGNRSVSSRSGSADLLEALGFNIHLEPQAQSQQLTNQGFCFLFAPDYHPGIRHAMPARKQLASRTIFNILGPLVNPARPDAQLIGVYDPKLCQSIAQTLKLLRCPRAMVVHGSGMDEIALHGSTQVTELFQGQTRQYQLTPADFGLTPKPIEALTGGDAKQNANHIQAVFHGEGQAAHAEAIAMNVAALLYLQNRVSNLAEGTQTALAHMRSGAVANYLTSKFKPEPELVKENSPIASAGGANV